MFFSIKLAAFQAGGGVDMKLHSNDGTIIRATIDDHGHEIHEKTRKIIFISEE
jgi:hypothetical protein